MNVGVGYSKLKERQASEDLTEGTGKANPKADQLKTPQSELAVKADAVNKTTSKSHDLLAETARLVKRAVGTSSDKYKQFVDADTDELDSFTSEVAEAKDVVVFTETSPIGVFRKAKSSDKKGTDSSSSGKKPPKPSVTPVCNANIVEGQNPITWGQEPLSWSHEGLTVKGNSMRPVTGSQLQQQTLLGGQELGQQSLLENDELLESESECSVVNPFLGFSLSKDFNTKEFQVMETKAFNTSAPLPSSFDVFSSAPFRRKSKRVAAENSTLLQPGESDTNMLIKDSADGWSGKAASGEHFLASEKGEESDARRDTFQKFRSGQTSSVIPPTQCNSGIAEASSSSSSGEQLGNRLPAVTELYLGVAANAVAPSECGSQRSKSDAESLLPKGKPSSDVRNVKSLSVAPVASYSRTQLNFMTDADVAEIDEVASGNNADRPQADAFDSPEDFLLNTTQVGGGSSNRPTTKVTGEPKLKGLILPFAWNLGDEGRNSPRSGKKEKAFQLDDEETPASTTDDENFKNRNRKKQTREKSIMSQFANLGFTDDPDALNQSMDDESQRHGQMVPSDEEEDVALEGNHTFPKTGAAKHRKASVTPDVEPVRNKKGMLV